MRDKCDNEIAEAKIRAEALVARGLALAYRRYSKSYIDEERTAKLFKCGAWAGEFTPPWQWRGRAGR